MINGLVAMPAPYAPFALMALAVMMGASLKPDLFGILAGHVWYFFTVVYPRSSGRCVSAWVVCVARALGLHAQGGNGGVLAHSRATCGTSQSSTRGHPAGARLRLHYVCCNKGERVVCWGTGWVALNHVWCFFTVMSPRSSGRCARGGMGVVLGH